MYLQYPPPQWFTGNLNNLIVTAIKKALPGLLDDLITKQGNAFLQNLVLSQTIDKYVKTTDIIHSTIKKSYRYSRTSAGLKCVARSLLQYKTPSFVVNLFLFSFLFSLFSRRYASVNFYLTENPSSEGNELNLFLSGEVVKK